MKNLKTSLDSFVTYFFSKYLVAFKGSVPLKRPVIIEKI